MSHDAGAVRSVVVRRGQHFPDLLYPLLPPAPATILVVENNDDGREVFIGDILRDAYQSMLPYWDVLYADDDAETFRVLKDGPRPDCIVFDLTVARMDARTFLDQLRELEPSILVIVMSDREFHYP